MKSMLLLALLLGTAAAPADQTVDRTTDRTADPTADNLSGRTADGTNDHAVDFDAAPQAASLQDAAERFARHWAAGESGALAELVAESGVRLHLDRASRSPLPARQASAALRDFFAGHRPGTARLGRVSEVGGVPSRGFAEVIWHAAAAGTTEMTMVRVYVGFVQEGRDGGAGDWKVDEIRILPAAE